MNDITYDPAQDFNKTFKSKTISNATIITDTALITALAVGYKIEPKDIFVDRADIYFDPTAIYDCSIQLDEAVEEYYANVSSNMMSVSDFSKWSQQFNFMRSYK